MSALTTLNKKIEDLKVKVAETSGRKGVTALRTELAELQAKMRKLDEQRALMKRNVQGNYRTARSEWHVKYTRELLDAASRAAITRGLYGEIVIRLPQQCLFNYVSSWKQVANLEPRLQGHPALGRLTGYWGAWRIISQSKDIPGPNYEFDNRGHGYAVNIDLYGYTEDGLVLAQVRRTEIRKYRNTTVRYMVTDGVQTVEITGGRKALIKRAAKADPSPDSPLRIIKSLLPVEWQARISDEPIKLLSYRPKAWSAWKVFRLYSDGTLMSMYDQTTWELGKQRTEEAQSGHGGGYYVRTGEIDDIKAQFDAGTLATIPDGRNEKWQAAVVRCECGGKTVRYSSGKIAVSVCKPIEIVSVW